MLLEVTLCAAAILIAAFWWSSYIRPENVLARLEARLGIKVAQKTDERLRNVQAMLGDRCSRLFWRLRGMVPRMMPPGPEQDALMRKIVALPGKPMRAATIDKLWNDLFWDLQNGSVAAGTTEDFTDLEDEVLSLSEDLKLLEKLERAA